MNILHVSGNFFLGMFFVLLFFLGLTNQLFASCDEPHDDNERSACLSAEFRLSDVKINQAYQQLMTKLGSDEKINLRDQQRKWLRQRATVCHLDAKETNREAWMLDVLQDYQKAVCVMRLTNIRETEIENLQRRLRARTMVITSTGKIVAVENVGIPPGADDIYDVYGRLPRSTGKWFFEVNFNLAEIAKRTEAAFFIGVKSNSGSDGKLLRVRKKDQSASFVTIGIAVDLDNGRIYVQENGVWAAGAPGTSGGRSLMLGRNYTAVVSSSTAFFNLFRQKIIDVNFGELPFIHALPDGYAPFQSFHTGEN